MYTIALVALARKERAVVQREYRQEYGPASGAGGSATWVNVASIIGGIAVIVKGADLLVSASVNLARLLGVSEAVIGLTVVAVGTSAPELATTVVATWKNERDVAVGNLIGSSIYNILVILGVTCFVTPGGVHVTWEILWIDLLLATAVALVCVPVFTLDRQVSRREGACFMLAYIAYLTTLIMWRF
jgi:cation:H+ antiporter